ncbi:MAG: conjugal transfer protein TraH [Bacteroidota bacterium]
MLKGGSSIKVLKCDETKKCLNPTEHDKTIEVENSFESKVDAYFQKFEKALKDDEELEDSGQNFLAKSGIPAYRIYDGLCQYTAGDPRFVKGQLVKHVAWNILYNYLSDMLREVTDATNNLKIASTQLKDFKKSLRNAKMSLSKLEQNNLSREKVVMTLIKNAKLLEESMAKDTSNIFSNI